MARDNGRRPALTTATAAAGSSVCHLSAQDVAGGAARAAYRLHRGLLEIGVDSSMLVARRGSPDDRVTELAPSRGPLDRFLRRLRRQQIARGGRRYADSRPAGVGTLGDDRSALGRDLLRSLPRRDVINLHWVVGFVDVERFFDRLPHRQPLVWTLHDMNPFTGGCHYDGGCGRWAASCGACPQLGSSRDDDLSRAIWQRKRRALSGLANRQLQIVAPSRWLAAAARRSALFGGFAVTVIPNGVPVQTFAPGAGRAMRQALGIPEAANVVLFVAENVEDRRKGMDLLFEALRGAGRPGDLHLLTIGAGHVRLDLPLPHTHAGWVEHEGLLAATYGAADLFVLPSVQDNLPNTGLEALACGTPVVGFDVGGIPEIVRPGLTGALVPPGDARALREAILALLGDEGRRREMSRCCRRIAVEEYALELQARRYRELYTSAVESAAEDRRAIDVGTRRR